MFCFTCFYLSGCVVLYAMGLVAWHKMMMIYVYINRLRFHKTLLLEWAVHSTHVRSYASFTNHPQSGVVYNFGRVCLSVCMYVCISDNNFRKPWRRKFIFEYPVYLERIRVKFVYEGHRVKVTEAKMVENVYFRNVKLRSAITQRSNIQPAAWGFRTRLIEWCDRHLCHVTGSDHA